MPLSLSTYIHIYIERELVVVAAAWRSINREPMMEEEMELRSLGSRARPSESRVCVFGQKKKRRMGDRSKESRACAFFLFQFHLLFFFFFFFFFFMALFHQPLQTLAPIYIKGIASASRTEEDKAGADQAHVCACVDRPAGLCNSKRTIGVRSSPPSPPVPHPTTSFATITPINTLSGRESSRKIKHTTTEGKGACLAACIAITTTTNGCIDNSINFCGIVSLLSPLRPADKERERETTRYKEDDEQQGE